MSVVVIRNGIIAADSCGTMGRVEHRSSKLDRRGDIVIGSTGNSADETTFVRWYFDGQDLNDIPKFHNHSEKDVQFNALVLAQDGWSHWDDWFVEDKVMGELNEYMAIGAGQEAAMGALHMGATAVEAVEAACAVITGCSLPVEWETVERERKVARINQ